MTDLYLIAHKVRGEPAFDVASRLDCPECTDGCDECGDKGYWWIIPTSGHRAYPFQHWRLDELFWSPTCNDPKIPFTDATDAIMIKDYSAWPDHYPHSASAKASRPSLSSIFKLKPQPVVRRRI